MGVRFERVRGRREERGGLDDVCVRDIVDGSRRVSSMDSVALSGISTNLCSICKYHMYHVLCVFISDIRASVVALLRADILLLSSLASPIQSAWPAGILRVHLARK